MVEVEKSELLLGGPSGRPVCLCFGGAEKNSAKAECTHVPRRSARVAHQRPETLSGNRRLIPPASTIMQYAPPGHSDKKSIFMPQSTIVYTPGYPLHMVLYSSHARHRKQNAWRGLANRKCRNSMSKMWTKLKRKSMESVN